MKVYTVQEVADKLLLSKTTIERMMKSGVLKYIYVGTGSRRKHKRVLETHLTEYLMQC